MKLYLLKPKPAWETLDWRYKLPLLALVMFIAVQLVEQVIDITAILCAVFYVLAVWALATAQHAVETADAAHAIALEQQDVIWRLQSMLEQTREVHGMANMIIKGGGPDPRKEGR